MMSFNSSLFDNLPLGFIITKVFRGRDGVAEDLIIEYINSVAETLLLIDKQVILGEFYYEEYSDRERILLDMCEEVVYTGKDKEHSAYRPKINKYVHFHVYRIDSDLCGILVKDITNIYTTERMVEKQAVTLQRIYDTMETGIVQIMDDALYTIVRANQSAYQIMGYTKESFTRRYGMSLLAINFADDINTIRKVFHQLVLYGAGTHYEHRIYNNHGDVIWLHSFVRRTKNSEGLEIIQIEFRNCTRRKQLQLQLEHERERYRMAMKNSKDVIFEYNIKDDVCLYFGSLTDQSKSKDNPVLIDCYIERVKRGEIVAQEDIMRELMIIRGELTEGCYTERRYVSNSDGQYLARILIESAVIYSEDGEMEKIIGKARIIGEEEGT